MGAIFVVFKRVCGLFPLQFHGKIAPFCFHFLDIVMQSSEFCEEKNAFLRVELFFDDFGGKKL